MSRMIPSGRFFVLYVDDGTDQEYQVCQNLLSRSEYPNQIGIMRLVAHFPFLRGRYGKEFPYMSMSAAKANAQRLVDELNSHPEWQENKS